jgi:hypothetical protein
MGWQGRLYWLSKFSPRLYVTTPCCLRGHCCKQDCTPLCVVGQGTNKQFLPLVTLPKKGLFLGLPPKTR